MKSLFPRKRPGAFSLVELAMAIGVASFALIAILGLIVTGYRSGGEAKEETVISGMSRYVLAEYEVQPYAQVKDAATNGGTSSYYFDSEGNIMPTEVGALYKCVVKPQFSSGVDHVAKDLIVLKMNFTWPLSSGAPKALTMYGSVANFN